MKENLIKVIVYPKTRKTKKGAKFTTYSTTMFLVDKREDSETNGQVITKSVSVKFGEKVDEGKILDTPMLLVVSEDKISAPSTYYIKEETNDEGELIKKYPVVWINEVISSKLYKTPVKQSQFRVNDEEIEENETFIDEDLSLEQ